MTEKPIVGVRLNPASTTRTGVDCWIIDYMDSPGRTLCYAFPKTALFYRAAEYGIDLSDGATLLDCVMHEHYIEMHDQHPKFVYNTDEATAREEYLRRVQAVKPHIGHTDPKGLLSAVIEEHKRLVDAGHYDELHNNHRETVSSVRAHRIRALGNGEPV